jgi:O-antigen/teichoic acid export membrane protein
MNSQPEEGRKKEAPGRVVSGVGWNFFGMIAGSIAGFLSSILVARWLGAAEFGNLSLALSVLNVLVVLSALGFEFALNKYIPVLLLEKNPQGIRFLVERLTAVKVVIALALSAFIFLAADAVSAWLFQKPALGLYLRVMSLMVLPFALEPIYRGLLTGLYQQKFINLLDVASKFLYLLLALFALWLGYGVVGVLLASLVAMAFFVALAARKGLASIPDGGRRSAGARPPLGRVLRFSFYLYLFSIMNFVLGVQLDLMMIGAMVPDIRQVAYYTVAYSLSYTILSFLSLALQGGITLTYFSELHARKDLEGLRRGFLVMMEYVYVFIIPFTVIGVIFTPEILLLLFGDAYSGRTAVMLLLLYFPTMAIMKFGMITSTFMGAMEKEKNLVVSRGIFGAVNLTLNFTFIPVFGAFGALLGTAAAVFAGLVYEISVVQKCLRPRYPWRFLGRMTALSLASGAAALLLKLVLQRLDLFQGTTEALFILAGAGLPWLALTALLFVALKPLSAETVDVVGNAPLPFKGRLIPMIRPRGP